MASLTAPGPPAIETDRTPSRRSSVSVAALTVGIVPSTSTIGALRAPAAPVAASASGNARPVAMTAWLDEAKADLTIARPVA